MFRSLLLLTATVFAASTSLQNAFAQTNVTIPATYDFEFLPHQGITMPDGITLSVNYWKPKAKQSNEKFPIVLEVLPYRKDDMHFMPDYSIGTYFARHGIAFARVDIRGTGSSEGVTPDREYSDQELADIPIILKQLAALPWSNGNVGMQGISWSAFNSIMTAMQNPPHLKGILVAHGSDDIYANDIHNIDGALHLDIFTLEIETDNLLPRSPSYQIDTTYFSDRFEQKPWIFSYLRHQRDGGFWQPKRSLQTNFSAIQVPVYAFASLLDGYRDFAINMLNHVRGPIRIAIGPQNHAWPDGDPGPRYEWRQMAVRFWQQVLNNKETGFWQEPKLTVFMRESVPSDVNLMETPGRYRTENWPLTKAYEMRLIPQKNHSLTNQVGPRAIHSLPYLASGGKGILNWWGETSPDMRSAATATLSYDSAPLTADVVILGNPKVKLKVAADAPLAHWVARLEDVHPDGSIAFVSGGLMNAAQRESRINPKAITIDKYFTLQFPMHFTTWTFAKGHKIRLVISNAQFPMVWPTPYKMTTKLAVGDTSSELLLPLIPITKQRSLSLPPLEAYESHPQVKDLQKVYLTPFKVFNDNKGNTYARAHEAYKMSINGNLFDVSYKVLYKVNDLNPADALFVGEGVDRVNIGKDNRTVKVMATIRIQSDKKHFHTTVVRKAFENGKLQRTRVWQESIPRDFE